MTQVGVNQYGRAVVLAQEARGDARRRESVNRDERDVEKGHI